MQVDGYFCKEFVNILTSCDALPEDILDKAVDFEKSDKMNPPQEKRAKHISSQQIQKEVKQIKQEAEGKEIDADANMEVIETIPLYKKKGNLNSWTDTKK